MEKLKKSPKKSKNSVKKKVKKLPKKPERCPYCDKLFKRLSTHVCENKLKLDFLETPDGCMALDLFKQWSKTVDREDSACTPEHFINHFSFNSICRFVEFINKNKIVKIYDYFDFLLKQQINMNLWTNEKTYYQYTNHNILFEDMVTGIEKSLININCWAEEHNKRPQEFFNTVSENRLAMWIQNGKISPWLIFINYNIKNIVERKMKDVISYDLSNILNEQYWLLKINNNKESKQIRDLLLSYGF